MIEDEAPMSGFGHNSQAKPVDILMELNDALEVFTQRRDYIAERANAKKVDDRVSVGEAADIIKVGGEVWDMVLQARLNLTTPLREQIHKAIGMSEDFWAPTRTALDALAARVEAFRQTERDLIARQKQEQEDAFAAMRAGSSAPAAKPADLLPAKALPIRADLGARVVDATHFEYEITDLSEVPITVLDCPAVRAAILARVRQMEWHEGIGGISRTAKTQTRIL
jgi:plasmid maintenance system antidote protein VapI